MKLVKISMELAIEDIDILTHVGYISNNPEKIADYLNNKLYNDPEYFGDFGPENIVEVKDMD
jgi:hypothetical protein